MGDARRRLGFWGVAYASVVVFAFSTAPSPLYVLYARRDGFSSLTITLIYAAYAAGVVVSLLLAGHLSDVHGRRPHLLMAVGLAVLGAGAFIAWPALGGLFTARVLCGLSVGLTVPTATAYLHELDAGDRAQLTAAAGNLGGLALGALLTGLLAQYVAHPLVTPYLVLLGLLALAAAAIVTAPETRRRTAPLPPYRPQRVSVPADRRPEFLAAAIGVFFAYAVPAVFIGLAGTFLAAVIGDRSLALAGGALFVVFASAVVFAVATRPWPRRRLLATGVALDLAGLAIVVVAVWLPAPSLGLFLVGGGVIGAAAAALFRGTLGSVVEISAEDTLGETLAGYFLAAYLGLSVPAIAVGIALQSLTPRLTLLALAIVVGAGLLTASRALLARRRTPAAVSPGEP